MTPKLSPGGVAFLRSAMDTHGALEPANLSTETAAALSLAGLSPRALAELEQSTAAKTGRRADGRIDSIDELAEIESIVGKTAPPLASTIREALLGELRRHSVRPLVAEDGLVLPDAAKPFFKAVALDVKGVNQTTLSADAEKAQKMCFDGAVKQAEQFFDSQGGRRPQLADRTARIQVALSETVSGRVEIDGAAALRARDYIDACLDKHRPVIVGVSCVAVASERVNEGITDHFVTISGRGLDDAGRLFYEFRDPGAGGATGRLYVDPDSGKLYKPGATAGNTPYVGQMAYEVSQVRTWRDLPAQP